MFKNQLSKIRYSILENCYRIKEGHIGSAFSVVEILFVIFKKYYKKNYFILSKGTCCNRSICCHESFWNYKK
jgi:transketolase N-terminal domain/subunit